MPEKRRRFDQEFRAGAVRVACETNKPIARVLLSDALGEDDGVIQGEDLVRA